MSVNGMITVPTGGVQLHGWGGAPDSAVIFMNAAQTHYLYHDASRFSFAGGVPVSVGEPVIGSDAATMNYVNGRTAFTPVEQGGGAGMSTNKVRIGWDNSGNLLAQVDGVPQGAIAFKGQIPSQGVTQVRLAFQADHTTLEGGHNQMVEPVPGGVITGWGSNYSAGYGIPAIFRMRYLQVATTGGFVTVAYA
jgi:hypothetical protein